MKHIVFSTFLLALLLCSCYGNQTDIKQKVGITVEKAYQGVGNYCHEAYGWSGAEDVEPSQDDAPLMYLEMGEESATEYQVMFRSYTGTFVYFYVDKASGSTRMEEYVPALDIRSDAGTIDLKDYLPKED